MRWRALIILLSLAPPSAFGVDTEVRRDFEASAIKSVQLENTFGQVAIQGIDGKTAVVVARKVKFADHCQLLIDLRGSTLVIANKAPPRSPSRLCEVAFDLQVPRQVILDLTVGTGNVAISGIKGSLGYKLGSGNLGLKDVDLEALTGRSGSGDVAVTGAALGNTDLKIGAGHTDIVLTRVPPKGHLDLKVGTGSTVILLPRGAKVRTTFKAGLGSLTNEFADSPNAAFSISGSVGAGDMLVKHL